MKTAIKSIPGILVCIMILAGCNQTEMKSVYIEGYDSLKYSVNEMVALPGQEIEVTLKTISDLPESQMAHNWVLLKKETNVEQFIERGSEYPENQYISPTDHEYILAETGLVGGGESTTITFNAPKEPGTYIYVCTFPAHYAAGMSGKLIVKE